MKKAIFSVLSGVLSLCAFSAFAAGMSHGLDHDHERGSAPSATRPETGKREAELVAGLVRRVDKAAGKITLSHEPLTGLGMPAMTMAFRVRDAAWLDRVKAGDKVRFAAESVGGTLTIVRLETSK
jgi:Cu/Ag efflux protein CusF